MLCINSISKLTGTGEDELKLKLKLRLKLSLGLELLQTTDYSTSKLN
jgi:hypothetical protein